MVLELEKFQDEFEIWQHLPTQKCRTMIQVLSVGRLKK
jgi:hypothetical protein